MTGPPTRDLIAQLAAAVTHHGHPLASSATSGTLQSNGPNGFSMDQDRSRPAHSITRQGRTDKRISMLTSRTRGTFSMTREKAADCSRDDS